MLNCFKATAELGFPVGPKLVPEFFNYEILCQPKVWKLGVSVPTVPHEAERLITLWSSHTETTNEKKNNLLCVIGVLGL